MSIKPLFLYLLALGTLLTFPALSEEVEDVSVDVTTETIFGNLDDGGREQFARILVGHGIIQSTTHTIAIVDKAVVSCGNEHPDLKKDIRVSFQALQSDTTPILKKAKRALKRTIAFEDVLPRKEMNEHLKLIDAQALEQASKVEPLPIKRLEDCQKLLEQLTIEKETGRLKNTLNETFGFEVSTKN